MTLILQIDDWISLKTETLNTHQYKTTELSKGRACVVIYTYSYETRGASETVECRRKLHATPWRLLRAWHSELPKHPGMEYFESVFRCHPAAFSLSLYTRVHIRMLLELHVLELSTFIVISRSTFQCAY